MSCPVDLYEWDLISTLSSDLPPSPLCFQIQELRLKENSAFRAKQILCFSDGLSEKNISLFSFGYPLKIHLKDLGGVKVCQVCWNHVENACSSLKGIIPKGLWSMDNSMEPATSLWPLTMQHELQGLRRNLVIPGCSTSANRNRRLKE
ncbi:hypothetical protein Tco_1504847 [Tanacetum coccineum]